MTFIRAPKPQTASLDEKWPLIIQAVGANPRIGTKELYKKFGTGVKTFTVFEQLCQQRGLSKLRESFKTKTISPKEVSLQLTEQAVQKFRDEREVQGYLFLDRMGEVVKRDLKIVERQSERLEDADDDVVDAVLPSHLDNVNKLHKVGAAVFGLNQTASVEDQQKLQLNVIMNFDPVKAKRQMQKKPIDIEATEVKDQ